MPELLNIVNEQDEIIGQETREIIHQQGLLHREIHVYFVTPMGDIIFQHRAPDKDAFPNLLDATVGGHVEIHDSYIKSALKESREETGLILRPEDLLLINKVHICGQDKASGKVNNVFNSRYLYIYSGPISALKIEAGKATGFELWSRAKLKVADEKTRSKFIPYIYQFATTELVELLAKQNILWE